VYSRLIENQEYTFGVSGKLIMNVLVMYDRQTGSLWSQLLGEAVEGELEGTRLDFLPSWQTTWADWKAQHPDTLALRKGFSGNYDPYDGYYLSSQTGVIGESIQDNRLYVKEFIVGVSHEGEAIAFPFSVLNDEPVVNHALGDLNILVSFNAQTGSGVVFNRRIDGRLLTFEPADGMQLRDEETGTLWDSRTGLALEGALEGQALDRVKSTSSFWFGWKDFFPQSEIYGLDP
jgi:hypothetical protein